MKCISQLKNLRNGWNFHIFRFFFYAYNLFKHCANKFLKFEVIDATLRNTPKYSESEEDNKFSLANNNLIIIRLTNNLGISIQEVNSDKIDLCDVLFAGNAKMKINIIQYKSINQEQ